MSLERDIQKLVESIGLSLYDTQILNENGQVIYRVSVTAVGGVTLDQCSAVTHLINPLLDVTPPMGGEYRLEVSSPGIERRLKTLEHFQQSIGEKVLLSTVEKEKIEGDLIAVDGDLIVVDSKETGKHSIPFRTISKARTFFEW
jgi:ribosome maturation factor RimP